MKDLDRHTIDLIARAVISGRRGYRKRLDDIADFVAGLMKNRLAAVGAEGARKARKVQEDPLRDPRLLGALLRRTEKLLASKAFVERSGGGAQAI